MSPELNFSREAKIADQTKDRASSWDRAWQRRLLPLMAGILIVAAIFFGATSLFELRDFYERVEHKPLNLGENFTAFEKTASPDTLASLEYLRFKTLALLEADALQRRYQQASSTMLARVWTRQLGFITGMLLGFVGAAFILGQLRDDSTMIEAEATGLKGTLVSSSPGIVLAFLGTLLMALTIWVPFGVETRDANTYLRALPAKPAALPRPATIDPTARERELFGPPGSGTALPEADR